MKKGFIYIVELEDGQMRQYIKNVSSPSESFSVTDIMDAQETIRRLFQLPEKERDPTFQLLRSCPS